MPSSAHAMVRLVVPGSGVRRGGVPGYGGTGGRAGGGVAPWYGSGLGHTRVLTLFMAI